MKIKNVTIKNFRSLKDVEIDFDDITTFIGPNGAGKSTVLRALDWFFNGAKAGSLSEEDCSYGAVNTAIEVRVVFTELTATDRQALGKYVTTDMETFTAWKTRTPDGVETLSANAKGYAPFTEIRNTPNATAKRDAYKKLRASSPELDLPSANTGTAVDDAMTTWESTHPDQLENVPEVQTNFFGFNSNSKMSGLFDFVLVTADLRASEEAQDAKSTVIGRILERSIDRSTVDAEVAEIVESSRAEQQAIYDRAFGEQLGKITNELNRVVKGYTPGRSVSVRPADVELKAPRTTFQLSIVDGETETSIDRQGHGFQRTLLISALQMLAQSGTAGDEGAICLAIEEPELYQHPIQAQAFAKVLRTLTEDESNQIQVMYATHSPYFIEAQKFHQVRRLTRSSDIQPEVSIHAATLEEVKSRLNGIIKPSSVESQLDGTISNQLSIAVFADRVFLVEGTTECAVFYGLGDREGVGSLEAAGISIVPVSGKMNIPLAHAILSTLGVPVYAMFDADLGFEDRASSAGKSSEKIEEERKGHISSNRKLLRYFGYPEADFPMEKVGNQVAILEDHLEDHLHKNWPSWTASLQELETSTGISARKNQEAYRTVTLRSEGPVPPVFQAVLQAVQVRA
ncbi:ATP-dependent endonuclease [Microbacterium sorbitolivorans]|uniref:DUF2813 domain-containing protein n=1 Tax=Microbacterium sorbitolivorans TaxID=1867410 RepID=A0A367Y2W6_9MICO|nr:ATP-dependent endonuclease [Microbacterium sorbitolivorans]RCK60225.1 DUF2813 domain-containing protein [Microbacterium sorbitolivorans]GGF48981.1 ATP-dependent endonuclease [Microbacterium sorbitolivorans]